MFREPTRVATPLSSWLTLLVVVVGLAVTVPPARAGGGKRHFTIPGFALNCKYAKSLPDDPVLRHGHPGASPGNDFYGATNVDANSTFSKLRRSPSSCITKYDTSAYFQPQLLLKRHPQTPRTVYDYY